MLKKNVIVNLIVGLVLAVAVFFVDWGVEKTLFHKLCDSCFVAGVVLAGMGGLKFARNAGTFDIMAYGIGSAFMMTFPWIKTERKDADFVAYKERKKAERKPSGDLLIAGAVYLVLAFSWLGIYQLTL